MNERDRTRLRDMLDATRKAQSFSKGKTREALHSDDMLAFALARAIEIIGEAASRVSEETRNQLPQIPWKSITGMRNKMIHDYVNVDNNVVWDTVTEDLPGLSAVLETLFSSQEEGSNQPPDQAR